mgnify:CR=1 FL=1
MKYILFISFFTLLSSCTITRTKKIEINFTRETPASLQSFLDGRVEYDKADIATLNSINALVAYNDSERLSVPEAYFFNRHGYRVKNNFRGTNCGQVIKNTHQINTAPSDNKEHIDDWIKDYTFPLGEDTLSNTGGDYDAYIIITWAKFVEQLSSSSNENAINWYRSVKELNSMRIKVIFLNLDIQESWTLTDEQEKALGLNRQG